MELACLELRPIVVDEDFPADLELECVLAEGFHSVKEDQDHAEQTTYVGQGSIDACVRTIVLKNKIWLSKEDPDKFIGVYDLKIANNWSFIQWEPLLSVDIGLRLRKYTFISIDLILREEDMATHPHHIRKLEIWSILKHIIQVILLTGVNDRVGEVNIEFEGLLIEESSAKSGGIDTTTS